MFYLTNVFQFVVNYLNNRPFSQHYSVIKTHQTILHIAFDAYNQMNAIVEKHFKERRREISLICKKFSEF